MKISSRVLVPCALLCFALTATAARAQDTQTTPAPSSTDAPPVPITPIDKSAKKQKGGDRMVQHMVKELSLTPEQKKQIKPLVDDRQSQIDALNADTSVDAKSKRKKMHDIQAGFDTKVGAILTDEQKPLYKKMQEDKKAKHKGVNGGGDAPAATAPAPE